MIKFLGTAQKESETLLYFQYSKKGLSFCKFATSKDGLRFDGDSKYVIIRSKSREIQNYNWKNFRIAKQGRKFILTYNQNKNQGALKVAFSSNLMNFEKATEIKSLNETTAIVPDYKFNGKYAAFTGIKNITIATSLDLLSWRKEKNPLIASRPDQFDSGELEAGNAYVLNEGILLIYYSKNSHGSSHIYSVGACLFDKNDPLNVLWRSSEPLWEQDTAHVGDKLLPLGSVIINDNIILYWQIGSGSVYSVTSPIPDFTAEALDSGYSVIVKKHHNNPIISPRPTIHWDSRASFNSAAVFEDGKVHFLYRALGDRDLSVIGYATSRDGVNIDERSSDPVYFPREPFESPGRSVYSKFADHFISGGGYGGIEDPRLTRVEDRFYLTYVAFDGWSPPRAAMSSISVDDFLGKKWGNWAKAKLISAPGMVNKSAVLFPKKINGKYVMLHRVYPNILVDYLDDLEFDNYLTGHHFIPPRKKYWDSKKVGAGAPPMLTKDGWLLIYQSVGYQDPSRYKIGAMMLDYDNPSKVLYRTHHPIIEPDQDYENNGFKAGVVYPCGAVIMDEKINIYYGGSDSVVCSASANLNLFLDKMKNKKEPRLDRVMVSMIN